MTSRSQDGHIQWAIFTKFTTKFGIESLNPAICMMPTTFGEFCNSKHTVIFHSEKKMKEEANETLQTFAADMFALICGSTDFNKMAKLVGTLKKKGGS